MFLDSNYPEVLRVLHHWENIFIKYLEQKFSIKFAFLGQHWTLLSIKHCKKIKIFSTQSAKKPTIYDLLFFISLLTCNLFSYKWQ